MTGESDQLILDLPHRPALGAEDFFISASNQAAADIVDRWPNWPHASVVVVAPAGAGKTHLANVWRLKSGAAVLTGANLGEADVITAGSALLVEDLHTGIGSERARQSTCCGPEERPPAHHQSIPRLHWHELHAHNAGTLWPDSKSSNRKACDW